MKKLICFFIVLTALVVGACNSIYEESQVGIGREFSELKKSPCACLELKKAPELPEWLA